MMKNKTLYILLVFLLVWNISFSGLMQTANASFVKVNNNNIAFQDLVNKVQYVDTPNPTATSVSNRILKQNDNTNKSETSSVYVHDKPQFYKIDDIENHDNIASDIFDVKEPSFFHHIFRIPIVGININTIQNMNNGNDLHVKTVGKFNGSISSSYLYSLSPRFRIGPAIMHTNYNTNKKTHIKVNDSFSLLFRSEFVLYQNPFFELYTIVGAGLSFNTLSLIYTRLSISNKSSAAHSFKEYIVKPLINGSNVPHKTAYFYCSTYPSFNNLKMNSITDPKDSMKGITEFTGDGFGICVYQNTDKTENTVIKYEDFVSPETATSIPWFVGLAVDYNLNHIIDKLVNFTFMDNEVPFKNELGLSAGLKYFSNGSSTVRYKTVKSIEQYNIKYKGYLSVDIGLYMKL